MAQSPSLFDRIARSIGSRSILAQTASSYGVRPGEETVPGGFDPAEAALFEAAVESAYLVANADGTFDETERAAFRKIVAQTSVHQVAEDQIGDLLSDLTEQMVEDGTEKRVRMLSRTIAKRSHQLDVLRIAALMAHISGGVSEKEREVLHYLARGFDLEPGAVDTAIREAEAALKA